MCIGTWKRVTQAEVRATASPSRLQKFSATTAVWLFVRDPETLDDLEREDLAAFCQVSPTLLKAYRLIQEFLSMGHKREGQRLDTRARANRQERSARTAALCPWRRVG